MGNKKKNPTKQLKTKKPSKAIIVGILLITTQGNRSKDKVPQSVNSHSNSYWGRVGVMITLHRWQWWFIQDNVGSCGFVS